MKTPVGVFTRIGALSFDRIVDLRTAYASYLFYDKAEDDAYAIADFTIPLDMIEYLKRGNSAREASEKALDFVQVSLKTERGLRGPNDERITYGRQEVKLLAPIPKPTHMRDFMGFLGHYETMLRDAERLFPICSTMFRSITNAIPTSLPVQMILSCGPVTQTNWTMSLNMQCA